MTVKIDIDAFTLEVLGEQRAREEIAQVVTELVNSGQQVTRKKIIDHLDSVRDGILF